MSQDNLGLFDTPPTRREVRIAFATGGLLVVVFLLILPVRDVRLPELNAFVPMINSLMLLGELITAALLFAQASIFRSRALTVLGTCYVFAALLHIPHTLTFPGAFAPDGLLGAGVNSTAWLAVSRRVAFPIVIIAYVVLKQREPLGASGPDRLKNAQVGAGVLAAIALAGVITLLTTAGHDLLPPYFLNRVDLNYRNALGYQSGMLVLFVIAAVMLIRARSSVLDLWLMVALFGLLVESLLTISLRGRFTAGWYCLFVMTLFSHLIVMIALIAESNRLYARLALATAARHRERDARLMSMDAVTAAISHEVGQPLTAVGLNTSAALGWLTRARPDVKKAITALQAVSDAGKRTFDIIKSIRATFTKDPGRATEFNLNDLVRETTSLLDRELAASKVSLQLSLDETLPPIQADRVQMQRVLVNLVTNAIESLRAISDRPRIIAIRSVLLHGKDVLLQVSDTGTGIAPEETEHIFDAFFTTKETGTGLGLPLCRTIVEDHGGRLWASQGEPNGAIFHLRLPRSGALEVSVGETDRILTNLEDSLRWLRQTRSDDVADVIVELQNIVDDVRGTMRGSKR